MRLFKNRVHAGNLLARRLDAYAGRPDVIVLALPRGGVPLGVAVAETLGVALDVVVVRKLGLPGHPEYAIGAIGADGQCLLHAHQMAMLGLTVDDIGAAVARERREIARREALYRAGRPRPQLANKVVILVDDGMATGATMQLAVRLVRRAQAAQIVVAVPVAAADTCAALAPKVDTLVCLHTPDPFFSVGQWYEDFGQTSDDEVTRLLASAWHDGVGHKSLRAPAAPPERANRPA